MPKIRTKNYTEPEISPMNPTAKDMNCTWFVWCRFLVDGKWKQKIYKKNLNEINDFRQRMKAAEALRVTLSEQLADGFNPFTQQYQRPEQKQENKFENYTFSQALDFALLQCKVSSATLKAYKQTANYCKEAARRCSLSSMLVKEFKKQHIKLILEEAKKKRNWSNKAYNKHLVYLQAMLSRIVEWELIEVNPAHGIKTLAVAESEKYVPYTDEERERIKEHLYVNHYRFFVFLNCLFATGIRPKELLALKIKDIDLDNNIITITPDLNEENSKTKNIRKVPINQHLQPFFREMELGKYSKDCFVFGSPYVAGRGNTGSCKSPTGQKFGTMHPDYMKPSKVAVKRDTLTKLWKKLIIDGLGIQRHLYAAKHTSANAMILAGIELDALRELFGHSSQLMTAKYAKKVKEVYREQIMQKAPGF